MKKSGPPVHMGKGTKYTHPLVWEIEKLRVQAGMSQTNLSLCMGRSYTVWNSYLSVKGSLLALRGVEAALAALGKKLVIVDKDWKEPVVEMGTDSYG